MRCAGRWIGRFRSAVLTGCIGDSVPSLGRGLCDMRLVAYIPYLGCMYAEAVVRASAAEKTR